MKAIRSILSSLLVLWLSAFSIFSTSHMGHIHHFGSKPDVGFCSVDCHNADHHNHRMECTWAAANISTVGDISDANLFNLHYINSNIYPETDSYCSVSIPQRKSRAPPVNLL